MALSEASELALKTAEEKLLAAKVLFKAGHFSDVTCIAYYCVFHAISAVLLSKHFSFSSHGQAIGAFNRNL